MRTVSTTFVANHAERMRRQVRGPPVRSRRGSEAAGYVAAVMASHSETVFVAPKCLRARANK